MKEHTLGRKLTCTNVIKNNKHLSSLHCRLWRDESGIGWVEDTSSNGTFVDRKKLGKGNKASLCNLCEISLLENSGIKFVYKELHSEVTPSPLLFTFSSFSLNLFSSSLSSLFL